MERFKKSLLLGICALTLLSAFACDHRDLNKKEDLRILFVPGVADPFYYSMERGAAEKALAEGITLDVSPYPQTWDASVQIPILKNAVAARDYDLIMIAPVSRDALIAPLKEIYDKGIQIITVDTYIGNGKYGQDSPWSFPLCHIGTDNFAAAAALAETLAEQMGEQGKVYINTTTRETSTTEERKDGFIEGMSHFPEMEVINIDYNGDKQDIAKTQTLKALMDHPDLVAVFGTNVFSSQGVSEAVKNTGLSGAVKVAAWDATESLINSLKNGEVDLVLAQRPRQIGSLGISWAQKAFKNSEDLPRLINSGSVVFNKSNMNDSEMEQYIY